MVVLTLLKFGVEYKTYKKELISILNNLDSKFYNDNIDAVKENYNIAQNMWMDNDRMFDKYLNKII